MLEGSAASEKTGGCRELYTPELFIRQCLGQSESKNEAVDGGFTANNALACRKMT